MYRRHTTVKKNGKVHVYWRLVRSVRVGGKVRHKTVMLLQRLGLRLPSRLRTRAMTHQM